MTTELTRAVSRLLLAPALVEQVASRDGHLVLLENNPHWNMISTPGGRTERSRSDGDSR